MIRSLILLFVSVILYSCGTGNQESSGNRDSSMVELITVDPGHFHAALVQKQMYRQVSPDVHVYAPEGADLKLHIARIDSYNSRADNPTFWNEIIYTGSDFFELMLREKKGNVVVLSGNNRKKAEYISACVNSGLNVLADKPMIISHDDLDDLQAAFSAAEEKGVLIYDIMTERYEVTTTLQKLLSMKPEVFGTLLKGTEDDPSVTKFSVHHFSKLVSGVPLKRPAWFFDVEQQGEGIVDVTTHLVDLVQWECFPEQVLSPADVQIISAKRWPTTIKKNEFTQITGYEDYPEYLKKYTSADDLNVYANGEITYRLKDVHARVSVEWHVMPPDGGGDTHYSVMKGSICDLVIRQGEAESYVPTLYIENIKQDREVFIQNLSEVLGNLPYDSLAISKTGKDMLRIEIPKKYRVTHEEHFGQVTEKFLDYLEKGRLPDWEVPGIITKYYTTTKALELAKE